MQAVFAISPGVEAVAVSVIPARLDTCRAVSGGVDVRALSPFLGIFEAKFSHGGLGEGDSHKAECHVVAQTLEGDAIGASIDSWEVRIIGVHLLDELCGIGA